MVRLEIIANQALEELLMGIMPVRNGIPCYTMFRGVSGAGFSGWCQGDDVWPEENLLFLLYVEEEEATRVKNEIKKLRVQFPLLGLAAFQQSGIEEV